MVLNEDCFPRKRSKVHIPNPSYLISLVLRIFYYVPEDLGQYISLIFILYKCPNTFYHAGFFSMTNICQEVYHFRTFLFNSKILSWPFTLLAPSHELRFTAKSASWKGLPKPLY